MVNIFAHIKEPNLIFQNEAYKLKLFNYEWRQIWRCIFSIWIYSNVKYFSSSNDVFTFVIYFVTYLPSTGVISDTRVNSDSRPIFLTISFHFHAP